jgi:hypothetical protein
MGSAVNSQRLWHRPWARKTAARALFKGHSGLRTLPGATAAGPLGQGDGNTGPRQGDGGTGPSAKAMAARGHRPERQ